MKNAFVLAAMLAPLASMAQLVVTGSTDGNAMANNLLGAGYTLVGSASYTGGSTGTGPGDVQQSGFFTGGTSAGITMNSGILLTSGTVQNAVGPNNATNATYDWGATGTTELNTLASVLSGSAGSQTYDAAVLSFTFNAPAAGKLHFNYVFGSEEYNEYVDQFNDVFGFFLDGNNIALLPGSTTPVSIDSINLANNAAFYVNNATAADPFPASSLVNLQYDGFSTPLSVSADISAGDHTISLEIADTGDHVLDAGVFIQSGSFSPNPTPIGVPDGASTLALFALGLGGLALIRRKH